MYNWSDMIMAAFGTWGVSILYAIGLVFFLGGVISLIQNRLAAKRRRQAKREQEEVRRRNE
jgi:predicted phage tail protein